MMFRAAERIADAVLYEGYVLYPYRASAMKNRLRWQFGIIAPASPGDVSEPSFSRTECLIDPGHAPHLRIRVRFLQLQSRSPDGWDEGIPRTIDFGPLALPPDGTSTIVLPIEVEGGREVEPAPGGTGGPHVEIVRTCWPLAARALVEAAPAGRFLKLRVRVENIAGWQDAYGNDRDALLRRSLISAHVLLHIEDGRFVSLLDPPDDARLAAADCHNRHTWPALVGDRASRDLVLSSPILLDDYPAVAPESSGDLCDATEIDEILSLRIMTLTDEEKQEARATDPIARAIIDRTDALTPDTWERMHGTMRGDPPASRPGDDVVEVSGVRVARGSRVRLHPTRRADSMDMFLRDQAASVAGVYRTLDDRVYVAVTVDADPAGPLHDRMGRFFYFHPDELEPLADGAAAVRPVAPAAGVDSRRAEE